MSATPLETCLLLYVCMFNSGLIPMGYALYISLGLIPFLPLICGRLLLADLGSSHVLIVVIPSDVRGNNVMDFFT